ncbi:hypothetical protein BJ322DRAFT_1022593 [Thelephora terrestris]|uniref:Uncharacterized protein n=1 Tax=Thelephora terrestris TaxID=56493 RepID=A0A9P6HBW2_9AGAM|nr:hypothetical protein BJ322DRAFT_1022593 [Thelephora terrestris]
MDGRGTWGERATGPTTDMNNSEISDRKESEVWGASKSNLRGGVECSPKVPVAKGFEGAGGRRNEEGEGDVSITKVEIMDDKREIGRWNGNIPRAGRGRNTGVRITDNFAMRIAAGDGVGLITKIEIFGQQSTICADKQNRRKEEEVKILTMSKMRRKEGRMARKSGETVGREAGGRAP